MKIHVKLLAQQATLTSPSVTVYGEMDEASETVGNLIRGNTFTLEETLTAEDGTLWHRITLYNGVKGYIQGDFSTGKTKETEAVSENTDFVRALVGANVRAQADINAANIGKLEVGDRVPVIEEVLDENAEVWYLIQGSFGAETQGYIKASTAEKETEVPQIQEDTTQTDAEKPVQVHRDVTDTSFKGSHSFLAQTVTYETAMEEPAPSGSFTIDSILILTILLGVAALLAARYFFRRMLREIFGRKVKAHDRKRRVKR